MRGFSNSLARPRAATKRAQAAVAARQYDPNDVAAGRAFVKAYVAYVHRVEELAGTHEAAEKGQPIGTTKGDAAMRLTTPQPLVDEHVALHARLAAATKRPGKIGTAAKAVAAVLHPHFVKEEDYALPPLGLLHSLCDGKVTPEMKDALIMTERLRNDLRALAAEHKEIVTALDELAMAAEEAGDLEIAHFTTEMKRHARMEEEVTYPAAILVGEYLKTKLGK